MGRKSTSLETIKEKIEKYKPNQFEIINITTENIGNKGIKTTFIYAKCNKCNSENRWCWSNVREGKFSCECEKKISFDTVKETIEKYKPNKFDLIDVVSELSGKINATFIYAKCKKCKKTSRWALSSIRTGEFMCRSCKENKIKNEAEKAGLKLIGKGKDKNYKLYLFPCGHKQELAVSCVRTYEFKCEQCNGIYLNDGRCVKSNLERLVGNYLLSIQIEFELEKRLGKKTRHRTDFYILEYDLYIEVAGLVNDKRKRYNNETYEEKLQHKHELYYKNKNILYLYPSDFIKNDAWIDKINNTLNNISIYIDKI